MSTSSYSWPAATKTVVLRAGLASRESLDKLASRCFSASLAEYLAHALAIAADADAVVLHVDEAGVRWTFTAKPGDEFPQASVPPRIGCIVGLDAPRPVLMLVPT